MSAPPTGDDIRRWRLRLGWSMERLAREVGVGFTTVWRWETGKTVPSQLALPRLQRVRRRAEAMPEQRPE